MNIPDIPEVQEKLRRIRAFFEQTGYEAMAVGRQDNFAWLTGGGSNRVVITSEAGFTILVVTGDKVYVVSQAMDGPRTMDEELSGLGFEPVFLRWYEQSREEKAAELMRGKKALSDIPVAGADLLPRAVQKLHYPLTEGEMDKLRQFGRETESILRRVADELKPGMTEHDVEAMLAHEYARVNATPEVLLVGSDERIAKYRHPNPSPKRIERVVLLHPGVKKQGLHANVTRMVSFGEPDSDLVRRYDAASRIEAASLSMCVPGTRYRDILAVQKQLYTETGFADEWRNHYQGALTGYILADPSLNQDPEAVIGPNQAWDWFVTITGAKVEELGLNTADGIEVPSASGAWPVQEYEYNGRKFLLPEILVK